MTQPEFRKEMERLFKTYGPDKYPEERISLLWAEFKSIDATVFNQVVSRLISENSAAPMMPKFREALTEVRERNWATQKKQNSQDAARGYAALKNPEGNCSFSQYVVSVIDNKAKDEEAFYWAVKFHGMEKLERIYAQAKNARAS